MENTAEFSDQNSVQFTSTCPSAVSSPHVNPRGSGKRKQSLQPGGLGATLGYSCALGDPLAVALPKTLNWLFYLAANILKIRRLYLPYMEFGLHFPSLRL